MASSSSASSRYGGYRPRIAGTVLKYAMELPKNVERSYFGGAQVFNDRHFEYASYQGQPDCEFAFELCRNQRLRYLHNPGPADQRPTDLIRVFYTTLRMVRRPGPWVDDPAEWQNFREFSFSVQIKGRQFEFTTDHVTAVFKGISLAEAQAESASYAPLPDSPEWRNEVFVNFAIDPKHSPYKRGHLPPHMWLLDTMILCNLYPMGHDRERTELYSIILWWMHRGVLFDVGSIVMQLMFNAREKIFKYKGNGALFYYPRLIMSLMDLLGMEPTGNAFVPLKVNPMSYGEFLHSYRQCKRQLESWEALAAKRRREDEEAQLEEPAIPLESAEDQFRRRVMEHLEESAAREIRMEEDIREMRAEQREMALQVQMMQAQFSSWATHFPPSQPPPP